MTEPEPGLEWVLPSIPQSAAVARRHVTTACEGMPRDLVEVARLLTSELVANAVVHGDGEIGLQIRPGHGSVQVEVADIGEGVPEVVERSEAATGGRGLLLVEALSSEWGVSPARSAARGKSVWFRLTAGRPGSR